MGQQLRVNQILCRAIAEQKLALVDMDGMLSERRDIMVGSFVDELSHLFSSLDQWMKAEQVSLRQLIKDQVGI